MKKEWSIHAPQFGECQGKLHKKLGHATIQDTSYPDNPTNSSLFPSRFGAKLNKPCRYQSVDGLVAIGHGRVVPEGAYMRLSRIDLGQLVWPDILGKNVI